MAVFLGRRGGRATVLGAAEFGTVPAKNPVILLIMSLRVVFLQILRCTYYELIPGYWHLLRARPFL